MKAITRILISILVLVFPQLKRSIKEDKINYEYKEIKRNSICYCKSGKKYKNCHLIINGNQNKVALRQISINGKENVVVLDKDEANKIKGINGTNIRVKNTFSEIDIGLGANSGR